jgi:hypothetical protein
VVRTWYLVLPAARQVQGAEGGDRIRQVEGAHPAQHLPGGPAPHGHRGLLQVLMLVHLVAVAQDEYETKFEAKLKAVFNIFKFQALRVLVPSALSTGFGV